MIWSRLGCNCTVKSFHTQAGWGCCDCQSSINPRVCLLSCTHSARTMCNCARMPHPYPHKRNRQISHSSSSTCNPPQIAPVQHPLQTITCETTPPATRWSAQGRGKACVGAQSVLVFSIFLWPACACVQQVHTSCRARSGPWGGWSEAPYTERKYLHVAGTCKGLRPTVHVHQRCAEPGGMRSETKSCGASTAAAITSSRSRWVPSMSLSKISGEPSAMI